MQPNQIGPMNHRNGPRPAQVFVVANQMPYGQPYGQPPPSYVAAQSAAVPQQSTLYGQWQAPPAYFGRTEMLPPGTGGK